MSTAQHSIIPLSALTHAAIEATGYSPHGKVAIVYSGLNGISDISIHSLAWLRRLKISADEPHSAIAIIFPDADGVDGTTIDEMAQLLHETGHELRDIGGSWDTVIAHGGVRFRIFSEHGWLEEPETDRMSNSRLDELIAMFSGQPGRRLLPFDLERIPAACDRWVEKLASAKTGTGEIVMPDEGSLQAGAVRDAVIVWAVGTDGNDRLLPGTRFVPPREKPHTDRIDAAFSVLADRIGEPDSVHALACAAYLAWWSGYTRLAAHLYYRVRSTGQRSRLATLVWTALIRQIPPHWMR